MNTSCKACQVFYLFAIAQYVVTFCFQAVQAVLFMSYTSTILPPPACVQLIVARAQAQTQCTEQESGHYTCADPRVSHSRKLIASALAYKRPPLLNGALNYCQHFYCYFSVAISVGQNLSYRLNKIGHATAYPGLMPKTKSIVFCTHIASVRLWENLMYAVLPYMKCHTVKFQAMHKQNNHADCHLSASGISTWYRLRAIVIGPGTDGCVHPLVGWNLSAHTVNEGRSRRQHSRAVNSLAQLCELKVPGMLGSSMLQAMKKIRSQNEHTIEINRGKYSNKKF